MNIIFYNNKGEVDFTTPDIRFTSFRRAIDNAEIVMASRDGNLTKAEVVSKKKKVTITLEDWKFKVKSTEIK